MFKVNGEANRLSEACDDLKSNLPLEEKCPSGCKKKKKKATPTGRVGI